MRKYYIVYSGINNADYVDKVSVFPEGYNGVKEGKLLPRVTKLVYHDLGKGKEYCGIIVISTQKLKNGDFKRTTEEVRLPNEIAQNLIDFMADDTKMKNRTSISYSKTKSAQLRQTKVEIY